MVAWAHDVSPAPGMAEGGSARPDPGLGAVAKGTSEDLDEGRMELDDVGKAAPVLGQPEGIASAQ